jgi:hypothetical protein
MVPDMKNRSVLKGGAMKSHVLLVCLCLSFVSVSLGGPTLIYNGDFELGDTGFYSAYSDHTDDANFAPLDGGGRYMVAYTPQEGHPNWPAYGDHTSGSGLMFLANGATDQRVAWQQTNIPVVPGKDYTFTYYLSSWGTAAPARIETRINGQVLGTETQPTTLPSWPAVSYTWNSGTSTTATVEVRDLETAWVGNDFMLDDIRLSTPQVYGLFLGVRDDKPWRPDFRGDIMASNVQSIFSAYISKDDSVLIPILNEISVSCCDDLEVLGQ